MIERIGSRLAALCAVCLVAIGVLAFAASAASAHTEVVYSNFNVVPSVVNGHPNTDTYSAYINYFPFGGLVEFKPTALSLKSVIVQVDSFSCETGEYQYENCRTPKENKKFKEKLTASVYAVGKENEPEPTPLATSTEEFKLPYRPSTNITCPMTEEGKGYGPNCDVGGILATVTFKHFTPEVALPEKAIVLISAPSRSEWEAHPVNVGLETSFKAFEAGKFVEEPPENGGKPEWGSDPLPEDAYVVGKVESGWANYQPIIEVTGKS